VRGQRGMQLNQQERAKKQLKKKSDPLLKAKQLKFIQFL
jgi:hypothetical protein